MNRRGGASARRRAASARGVRIAAGPVRTASALPLLAGEVGEIGGADRFRGRPAHVLEGHRPNAPNSMPPVLHPKIRVRCHVPAQRREYLDDEEVDAERAEESELVVRRLRLVKRDGRPPSAPSAFGEEVVPREPNEPVPWWLPGLGKPPVYVRGDSRTLQQSVEHHRLHGGPSGDLLLCRNRKPRLVPHDHRINVGVCCSIYGIHPAVALTADALDRDVGRFLRPCRVKRRRLPLQPNVTML